MSIPLCWYCGIELDSNCKDNSSPNRYTIDHVLPLKKGGTNRLSNLVDACFRCNASKGSKTLEEFRRHIVGKSPIGRMHNILKGLTEDLSLDISDRSAIKDLIGILTPCPVVTFWGEENERNQTAA